MRKRTIVIIDLDGVFFDSHGIYKRIKKLTENFDKQIELYTEYLDKLKPNRWCLELICNLIVNHKICFVTARSDKYFDITDISVTKELIDYASVYHSHLTLEQINNYDIFMRKSDDYSSDTEYKKSVLNDLIEEYDVIFALDDDPDISKMYYLNGIPSLNVLGLHENVQNGF